MFNIINNKNYYNINLISLEYYLKNLMLSFKEELFV